MLKMKKCVVCGVVDLVINVSMIDPYKRPLNHCNRTDEDPMEFLRDVSPKETCDKLHSRYSEKSPLDKQILLNARKQTKGAVGIGFR